MIRGVIFFIFSFFISPFVYSQNTITAVRTNNPPVIDGIIDEAWDKAVVIDDFYQRVPYPGEPVSEKTEFLLMYDSENLYVAARCYHVNLKDIISKELARDADLAFEDRIQVILDTYHDRRNGYWFQIGPRGSIGDALVSENGRAFNKSWDGIWEGKSSIHENGWDTELMIPFTTLSFKEGQEDWGIKLIRNIRNKLESSYWPSTTLDAEKFQVSDAGILDGLEGINQGLGLNIVPYLTTGVSRRMEENAEGLLDVGMDAFYQITPSLKAAVTVNTDFAQAEVDARQINLTRFSLLYPEKRDFFLDGANYFNFGINGDRKNPQGDKLIPFFSRRVGLDPGGNPVPVNYGGKFIGQVGDWNIGALHIKDKNQWENPGYSVARISRNIGKQSYLGGIFTDGNSMGNFTNRLAGLDLMLATSEWRETKTVVYNLYGLKSFSPGLEGNDWSFGTEFNYPNDFLEFRMGYMQIGEDFFSGLGFIPRKNIRNIYGGIEFGPRAQEYGFLKINTGVHYYFINDLKSGNLESSEINLRLNPDLMSGDAFEISYYFKHESLDNDFNIIDSVIVPVDDYDFGRLFLKLASSRGRDLWGEISLEKGSFYTGDRTDWIMEAGFQIAPPVFIGLASERSYVHLAEGNFVTQILRMNLNLLFSPEITLYNFAQYDNVTESLGIQSRFQWIIKPGKEIFFVYNSPAIRDPLSRFRIEEYEARLKLKYVIIF